MSISARRLYSWTGLYIIYIERKKKKEREKGRQIQRQRELQTGKGGRKRTMGRK